MSVIMDNDDTLSLTSKRSEDANEHMINSSDQPSSMCHVRAAQLFPLAPLQVEAAGLASPFAPLCGEAVELLGRSSDGILALSNYRLYLETADACRRYSIPLGLIEQCEVRDIFYLHVYCKDARTVRVTFGSNEHCLEWFRRVHRAIQQPHALEEIFAFAFHAWAAEAGGEDTAIRFTEAPSSTSSTEQLFKSEVERLRFDTHGAWRISQANINYRLCPSYPPLLLVPACITDETLETVARFRSSRRVPAVVWRHTGNGAVIARCSQPEVGWLGWRSAEDEDLLKAMADACAFDRGARSMLDVTTALDTPPTSCVFSTADDNSIPTLKNLPTEVTFSQGKKVLIMDARSYTTAVANRARGGGCECPEYYPSCDIEFMNLANIHSIRKSFHAVRQLCAAPADQPNWFSVLEGTRWLQHMSGLIHAATTLAAAIERDGRPVLVHCSDGWDRTPQIVALGQLLLDPYYRTIEGFRVLVEREWLDFGHKFADRCGHAIGPEDPHERCPVFLQWLDCVHQLLLQFPCSFEFSHTYLVKLAQHTYSNLFGTFLCNTKQDRINERVADRTFSVWPFLKGPGFRNHLYTSPTSRDKVLWPVCNVRDLHIWSEVYLGSLECNVIAESGLRGGGGPMTNGDLPIAGSVIPPMTKTRSYGDLMRIGIIEPLISPNQPRRSSDPSIIVESMKIAKLSISDNSEELDNLDTIEITTNLHLEHSESPSPLPTNQNGDYVLPQNHSIDKSSVELKFHNGFSVHNGDMNGNSADIDDSDNEDVTEPTSEGRSEITLCASPIALNKNSSDVRVAVLSKTPVGNGESVETSTETLVAETGVISNLNGGEIQTESTNESHNQTDTCKVCAQNRKFLVDKHHSQQQSHSASTSGKNSRYSTPPLYSRTPSHPATPLAAPRFPNRPYDVDGMVPLHSSVQRRLEQIVTEHKMKQEALERELHTTRMALIQQVCHHCNHNELNRHDETCSLVGSVCSAGEGHASANESLPSDMSWEALEEPITPEAPTLWVPDHAVSRCMGCHTEFWLGRRKHHCRNCGKIFCADCSENSTPLPNEQLYNPVRVCTSCFSQLRCSIADNDNTLNGDLENSIRLLQPNDRCKNEQSATASRQKPVMTAASN